MSAPNPEPHPLSILPFAVLLLAIALAPALLRGHWHRHYAKICAGFAALTVAYYMVALHAPGRVLQAGWEYLSFIAVVGALYFTLRGYPPSPRGYLVESAVGVAWAVVVWTLAMLAARRSA